MNSEQKNREYFLNELTNAESHLERKRVLLKETELLVSRETIDALGQLIKAEKDNDAILRLTATLQILIRALRDGVQAAIGWDAHAELFFSAITSQSVNGLKEIVTRELERFTDAVMDEVAEEFLPRYRNETAIMDRYRVLRRVVMELATENRLKSKLLNWPE